MCLGIPGQVVAIEDEEKGLGVIDVAGVRRVTNLVLVREEGQPLTALIGSWVLIHVGFAMSRIDESEAQRTLDLLHEMGELMDREMDMDSDAAAQARDHSDAPTNVGDSDA